MDVTMMAAAANSPVDSASTARATQIPFHAVDDPSKRHLSKKWTGSIKFRSLAVHQVMIGSPLDKTAIQEVDICYCLGRLSAVAHLHLDPEKHDKPPLTGEPPLANNPHWKQLKNALEAAAHTSGSPIMCDGGKQDTHIFTCKVRNRAHASKSWGRRTVRIGKMIASTWTRVADAPML
jgi:hypothetical protein